MISASPHLYEQDAAARGIPPKIARRALEQAKQPERKGLPAILTLRHLAHLTGADYTYLRSIVSRTHDGYRIFTISKRGGGARFIAAPEPTLAAVQRWISRRVLLKRQVHPGSYAYSLGTSPVNCARRHLGSRWLIKVDIHDFFESISERRVYFAFRECGYQPLVSFELARICTKISHGQSSREERWQSVRQRDPPGLPPYKSDTLGHLPQGAPTSPMLSNLVSEGLDRALQSVADRHGLVYTRYSDDVIFSTASSNFSRTNAWHLVTEVERIFAAFGHELHRRKITIAPPGARKIALGLLVNGNSLRLSRELRSRISDHVRGIEKFGVAHHARHRHFASLWGLIRHVQGLLSHAAAIEPTFAAPLKSRLDAALIAQGWPPPT